MEHAEVAVAEVREPHTDVIMLANSVRELVHQKKQEKAGLWRA